MSYVAWRKRLVFCAGEIRLSFNILGSNVSRTLRLFEFAPRAPPTPSKPITPVVTAGFGRQRLNAGTVAPAAGTPGPFRPFAAKFAAVMVFVPIVLIVTPFEPVVVIG